MIQSKKRAGTKCGLPAFCGRAEDPSPRLTRTARAEERPQKAGKQMRNNGLAAYDTSVYDRLPVTVVIFESVFEEDGAFSDYRIVYGNPAFAKDFRRVYGHDGFLGNTAVSGHLVDDFTIGMMHQARGGQLQAFSTYIPLAHIHVHMEPLRDLPDGYLGYLMTNIADYDEQESRAHFLRVVAQMNNNAVLYRRSEDGTLTTVNATPSFCEMMGCDTKEDALRLMDGDGLLESTFEEDRGKVLDLLKNRIGPDGTRDMTIRKISRRGETIWCNVHYAFIDDYDEHYIYSTYSDVTVLKKYEEQLKGIYANMGSNFYQADGNTLLRMRVNLTKDLVEESGGTAGFPFAEETTSFSDVMRIRVSYFPIEEEKAEFLDTFGAASLTRAYLDGHVTASRVLYSRLPDGTVSYVKITANVTRHPMTGDIVAFLSEESNNPEKLASTIYGKILAKQFDLVAYIARDIYDVAIGDSSLIKHGNIFPKEKHGSYNAYLEEQILPALKNDESYRAEIREAMRLETVFKMFAVREPYSVDIEVEMEDGVFSKRFDFYSVDPESEYCIVLKTDTTELRLEQKRQEEKARELEHSKRELADAEDIIAEAGFGLWHIVLEDGREPRMRGNAKMMELLGITDETMTEEEVYKSWYSRILPEEVPSVEKSVGEMLSGQFSENTYRWEHPTRGILYVRCGGTASSTGTQQLLRGYHSDVTEFVREDMTKKEALSNALAAAEHANRAKTVFLNNMSHDIRTPMNAIVGFTALAASHIESRDLVRDYLGKISVSSQHLLSLINDVLDMSRIESGKMTLEECEVHLPDMIHDLRTILQANVSAKQLELFIDTLDVKNEDIITDKLRLNQVFLNILSNAIKFTPAGGTISFRVIEKPAFSPGLTSFEFRIRDTGIGMSEEFRKTIFEAFTREKTSTVSGIQGTGLGMAITKSIVDMMGGTIYVNSTVGKGTEFVVNIPCKVSGRTAKYEQIPELSGVRVLVVDDDTNTCLSVCRMLRDIGMRPDWTNYGKEAVVRTTEAADQADGFGVFIVDWMLPDLNGIETVRRIRKVIGDDTPIIVLTAYDWADIEEEAKAAGVTAFCSKPIFLSELRTVLSKPFLAAREEKKAPEKTDFTGKRILLAEDNEMNQMIAEAILTESGFALDIASDGEQAVELMRSSPAGTYDVILMDIQMPRMDGYEASKQIRMLEDREKASVPIIAVTANAFEEDRKLALEAGMNGHLAKPYDIPKMMETLSKLLG